MVGDLKTMGVGLSLRKIYEVRVARSPEGEVGRKAFISGDDIPFMR